MLGQKKKRNSSELEKETNFLSNSPISDENSYGDFVDILESKIDTDESVKNIGIIAPYGAGKSSLIKTYQDRAKLKRNEYITISLANFNVSEDENGNKEKTESNTPYISDIECEVEKSILQQIIYKVGKNKVPASNLTRIDSRYRVFSMLISTLLILAITSAVLFVFSLANNSKINFQGDFIVFCILFVAFSITALSMLIGSRKLSKLAFKNMEADFCLETKTSVLNRFIEEIIYFFNATGCRIVFIEDLERFDNLNIFSKLRELNFLINNNDTIKRKVVFIYAVKDDMFQNETERAKFFDFILPVIPVLNPQNAADAIVSMQKSLCDQNMFLSETYIKDVSYFVPDMRVLKNIFNDYKLYYKKLEIGKLNDDKKNVKLFSLMVYKNLFPKDYSKLQFKQGKIAEVFKKKKILLENKILELKTQNEELKKRLENANEYPFTSEAQFAAFVESFLSQCCCSSKTNYGNKYMHKSFIGLEDSQILEGYANGYKYSISVGELSKKLGRPIQELEQVFKDNASQEKFNLTKTLNKNNSKIHEFTNLNLTEAITELGAEIFFDEEDALTNFLLSNGYIAEDYPDYIAVSGQLLINDNDREFIRNVISKKQQEYGLHLDNPEQVISEISEERFKSKYILNFDLIIELLKQSSRKKATLIDFVATGNEDTNNFILSYLSQAKNIEKRTLIKSIAPKFSTFWDIIFNSEELNDDLKEEIAISILNLGSEIIKNQNNNSNLSKFINSTTNIIDKLGFLPNETFKSIMTILSLKIMDCNFSSQNLNKFRLVFELNSYEVNRKNLQLIFENIFDKSEEQINGCILTSILNTKNDNFINNMKANLENFLEADLTYDSLYEEQEAIELVLNSKLDYDKKAKLIEKQEKRFNIHKDFTKEICELVFEKNKFNPIWSNIFDSKIDDTDVIKDYLSINCSELSEEKLPIGKSAFNNWLLNADLKNTKDGKNPLEQLIKSFADNQINPLQISNDKNYALLVSIGKIPFTDSTWQQVLSRSLPIVSFSDKYPDEVLERINNLRDAKVISEVILGTSSFKIISYLITNHFAAIDLNNIDLAEKAFEVIQQTSFSNWLLIRKLLESNLSRAKKVSLFEKFAASQNNSEITAAAIDIDKIYSEIITGNEKKFAENLLDSSIMNILKTKSIEFHS